VTSRLVTGTARTGADGQSVRSERESKEKDTHKLIIEVAERLFRQIGFQKTTVGDIARDLHMSPANVYRFFAAKSEINEAVCMDLLGKIEAEAEKISASRGTSAQKIHNVLRSGRDNRKLGDHAPAF
jgi:AcrR family transcriptional regulator